MARTLSNPIYTVLHTKDLDWILDELNPMLRDEQLESCFYIFNLDKAEQTQKPYPVMEPLHYLLT